LEKSFLGVAQLWEMAADSRGMDGERRRGTVLEEPDAEIDRWATVVIGAAIEVHRTLGPGFLEAAYENAMAVELGLRSVPFRRRVPVAVLYKGARVADKQLDLLVADGLVVELKAVAALAPVHSAQVRSYLKASGCSLGLLINFNVPVLREGIRRVIDSR
jgi:GxxExxY protein